MPKTRAVVVGGKGFNIPKQLHRYFEVVRHFEQDKSDKIRGVPDCDIILVIRDYVHHGAIQQIVALSPGTPIVAAKAGWSHLYTELVKRKLLPTLEPEAIEQEEQAEPARTSEALQGLGALASIFEPEPIPVEEQISDEELERLTAPGKQISVATAVLGMPNNIPPEPTPADRVETLAELFKATNGELTTEVRDLYVGKYKEPITGPVARLARRKIGLGPRTSEKTAVDRVAENPVVREALILYGSVEKLVDRRNEILAAIEEGQRELVSIDKDLEIYKPLIQNFEALKKVQQQVKSALEQKAMQERKAVQQGRV